MSNLIVCETDKGNFAVRPIDWAGIWTEDGKLKEVGFCAPAVFRCRKDAEEYARFKNLHESGRLLELPCAIGDTVYEIIHDDVPVHIDYICKYTVEDISARAIKFAEDWNPLDSIPNVYYTREEAEEALRKLKGEMECQKKRPAEHA